MCRVGSRRTGKLSCSIEATGDHTAAGSWSALQNVQLSSKRSASRLSRPASTPSTKRRKWPTRSISQSVMVLPETSPMRSAPGGKSVVRSSSRRSSCSGRRTRSWRRVTLMDRSAVYLMMISSELSRSCRRSNRCTIAVGKNERFGVCRTAFVMQAARRRRQP